MVQVNLNFPANMCEAHIVYQLFPAFYPDKPLFATKQANGSWVLDKNKDAVICIRDNEVLEIHGRLQKWQYEYEAGEAVWADRVVEMFGLEERNKQLKKESVKSLRSI